MVETRRTPAALNLEGYRVMLDGDVVVLVEHDRELLLGGSFRRYLTCRSEITGLVADLRYHAVKLKPGDVVRGTGAGDPVGLKGGLPVFERIPSGTWLVSELTEDGEIVMSPVEPPE